MATSDAFVVGEDWISEHYFATDSTKQSFQARVLDRRKEWEVMRREGHETPRTRFSAMRADLEAAFAGLAEDSSRDVVAALHGQLRDLLGYPGPGLAKERIGPVLRLEVPHLDDSGGLAVIDAVAVDGVEELLEKDDATLLEPYIVEDEEPITSVARLLSALFVAEDGPDFALVLAGGVALVAEKERWPEGRYLAVDLQLVCERAEEKRGGEVDRALTCLEVASLAPDAEGRIWWRDVLDESITHTVGVSQDLREGVRLSIEIIANEVVARRRRHDLAPLPPAEAQPLAVQSLRFLYRILFLLYAEASPELRMLPVGAQAYERGYSLDRLRELTLVQIASPRAEHGTHLYDSLSTLFDLVDSGHDAGLGDETTGADEEDDGANIEGLTFEALRADLFSPTATHLIDEVGLGNGELQRVLQHLLLSKETRGKDRGFISYAQLGINQLGAVYEGLMSYTGFFAGEDLYEVAKDGNAEKGSWVVPVTRVDGIAESDFVREPDPVTGEDKPVLHKRGTFVFRLSGRERQQSASYYTPEVLTRFTVGQALEELITDEMSARTILDLTVCEPALGSGAFAIEAVRQLADTYLRRRQSELGVKIPPEDYPAELQKVKSYIALHQVHGVDLNATAVELAEISLWLDTMGAGLQAPWFGLRLRRGNSLIGARRAVFRADQMTKRAWQTNVPRDVPMTSLAADIEAGTLGGEIHHFLLPARGWGSAVDAREGKVLAADALDRLKQWRKGVLRQPTKTQAKALADLAQRVERLWQTALRRLTIAEVEARRKVDVWGSDGLPVGGGVTREQIEAALADEDGSYRRLRRAMDAWCALWFWPLTDTLTTVEDDDGQPVRVDPPTLEDWISGLQDLLGTHRATTSSKVRGTAQTFAAPSTWDELDDYEETEIAFSGAKPVETVLAESPWLRVCERIAEEQGFFHWDLDFASVMSRGGFDLQLGNPPWVRPRSDVDALLAEGDPWWQLAYKPTEAERSEKRVATLALPGVTDLVIDGTTDVAATAAFLGEKQHYPLLVGLQPDLYRCFMEQTWRHLSARGAIGLIHPETHFTDEKARLLRSVTYERLRRHWHFVNELILFEIDDKRHFGVHIYGREQEDPAFLMATYLYHPDTVTRSFAHDGSGEEPGLKDPDGNWDLRPHWNRIIHVDAGVLGTWHAVLESDDVPIRQTRMVYTVNTSTARVLGTLAQAPRIGDLDLRFSRGWDESIDRKKGYFTKGWGAPESWGDVILQGPHLHVAIPFYKSPNPTMKHNQDWSEVDLETLDSSAVPITAYKPASVGARYDGAYDRWTIKDEHGVEVSVPARDYYRLAWRAMAANTGERTLIPAVIPPGPGHINGVFCIGLPKVRSERLVGVSGFAASLINDFAVRVAPKSGIYQGVLERLPFVDTPLSPEIRTRALRLNAVSDAYAGLWANTYTTAFHEDSWTGGLHYPGRPALGDVGPEWTAEAPLRRAVDRRQALVEIDALVALSLGVSADELCTIYRTQFPVLYGYDRRDYVYDANGRLVPHEVLKIWRTKGDRISEEERTATHPGSGIDYTYELPFRTLDREADMRTAYAEFERRLAERTGSRDDRRG